MNKQIFYSLLFSLTLPLFSNEVIEICLPTTYSLSPIYLSRFQQEGSSFESTYLENLREVLAFDLNYCGYAQVVTVEEKKEQMLSQQDLLKAFFLPYWNHQAISFVVRARVEKQSLSLVVFSKENQGFKSTGEVSLSGTLSVDRKKIHQLSDRLVELAFHKKGIAATRILYSVRTKNPKPGELSWISEIWTADYDGDNARCLTHEQNYSIHPLFIPDLRGKGDQYLYVSYKSGEPKIYCSSFSNPHPVPLVSLCGNQLLPALSLRGDKLAFISDAAGRPDLFIQGVHEGKCTGSPVQLFSLPRSTQASSTFSPDGKRVAFVSDKDGSPKIYVMQLAERVHKRPEAVLVTKKNLQNVSPAWSLDGKKLAYSAKTDDVRQIWIYDFESGEEWALTSGSGTKENPCWAADSLHLIFNTEDRGVSELYMVNLRQPEAIKITKGFGEKRFPSWEISK